MADQDFNKLMSNESYPNKPIIEGSEVTYASAEDRKKQIIDLFRTNREYAAVLVLRPSKSGPSVKKCEINYQKTPGIISLLERETPYSQNGRISDELIGLLVENGGALYLGSTEN